MRISDWSSDVCSSDLASVTRGWTFGKIGRLVTVEPIGRALWLEAKQARGIAAEDCGLDGSVSSAEWDKVMCLLHLFGNLEPPQSRSEARRVGEEWVSTCRSRWSQYH